MGAVARRIAGQGNLQADWEASRWLQALPESTASAVLHDARRLVVISPHPDDEVLGCAGIMQSAAAAGIAIHVISVTDGEACYPDQPLWPPLRLRDARRWELASAMRELGLDGARVTPLGLPDGGVTAREDELTQAVASQLVSDDVVLAPWVLDGHPDHEAVGRAALAAAADKRARVRQYPVWAWHWLDTHAASSHWTTATRIPMSTAAMKRKATAIRAFATQIGDVEGLNCEPILPHHVTARFHRPFEVLIG
ncbi:PIG-L family deacetylase [Stenotrophomonas sp. PS02289]|uniref:PIG-L deacetylase family protein n=1 Tax=Stenotrophomonas sp. PS02289 TaxID=2991422 RepID=UPI00249C132A|nr:PIG-L family deacetylase [Stenotrophomonas sp. PS02289]